MDPLREIESCDAKREDGVGEVIQQPSPDTLGIGHPRIGGVGGSRSVHGTRRQLLESDCDREELLSSQHAGGCLYRPLSLVEREVVAYNVVEDGL